MSERYFTVKEAATIYFQGKVSAREIYLLFSQGKLRGFKVGAKILIYESSLDAYRCGHENGAPTTPLPAPVRAKQSTPTIRLSRLPD